MHSPFEYSPAPSISIVVPCYNQAQFLQDCLDSLLGQTFDSWEAIVVDDASAIGDPEEVVLKVNDPRIRLVRHVTNKGVGAARNTGFRNACASTVLILDADDSLEPSFMELTWDALMKHPEADCVFTDIRLFGDSNKIWHLSVRTPPDMLEFQWIPGAGTLIRKQVWVSVGGYSECQVLRYGNEDWDFWIAVVEKGITAVHIPQPLYLYRRWAGSRNVTTEKYFDFAIRDFIYRRHKVFFDMYSAGPRFRAGGYMSSSQAALKQGKRLRSFGLALKGFLIDKSRRDFLKLAAKALTSDLMKRS